MKYANSFIVCKIACDVLSVKINNNKSPIVREKLTKLFLVFRVYQTVKQQDDDERERREPRMTTTLWNKNPLQLLMLNKRQNQFNSLSLDLFECELRRDATNKIASEFKYGDGKIELEMKWKKKSHFWTKGADCAYANRICFVYFGLISFFSTLSFNFFFTHRNFMCMSWCMWQQDYEKLCLRSSNPFNFEVSPLRQVDKILVNESKTLRSIDLCSEHFKIIFELQDCCLENIWLGLVFLPFSSILSWVCCAKSWSWSLIAFALAEKFIAAL